MNDKKLHQSVSEAIKDWPRLTFPMEGIEEHSKSYKTCNLKKDKEGLFSIPANGLTLQGEAEYSKAVFKVLVELGEEIDIDFGFDYGPQVESVVGGIKGIVHWYVCQWFKSETLSSNDPIKTLPLKAVYVVQGKELFLGSLFRLLARHSGFANYAQLGQVICVYLGWCQAKRALDFDKLERLSHRLFALGHNMAKAEYEREIIAGQSRTENAIKSKGAEGQSNKQRLIDLLPDTIEKYRNQRPNAKKVVRADIFRMLEKRSKLAFDTIKRHLREVDFDNFLRK